MRYYKYKDYTNETLIEFLGDETANFIIEWFAVNKKKTVLKLPNGVKIRLVNRLFDPLKYNIER